MGRRKKCDTCVWVTYKGRSKKILEVCDVCGDTFPCVTDCGHFDCADKRDPKCFSCGRKVSGPEYNLIAGSGTGCYFVHERCADEQDVLLTVKVDEL